MYLSNNQHCFNFFSKQTFDISDVGSNFMKLEVHFSLGIMHCSKAIQTCVGDSAGRPLRDHFKIVRKLAWDKNRKILEGETEQLSRKKKPTRRFFVEDNV